MPRFSFTDSEVSTISYFVALIPDFLSSTHNRKLYKQANADAAGLPKWYYQHCVV
jgi:hypothetical protein